MRITGLTLLLSLLGAGAALAQDAARGQKVYAAEKCSVCHSVGEQGNKRGPLDTVGTRLSADDIRAWIVDAPGMTAKTKAPRKPPMRAYAQLSKEDVDALVTYLQTLKK